MPAPDATFIRQTSQTSIQVGLEPAHNVLHSMMLLNKVHELSGYSQWVVDTAVSLTPQQASNNVLVLEGLHYAVHPYQSWSSFPAYLDHLAMQDPVILRDNILNVYVKLPSQAGQDSIKVNQPTDIIATLGTYLDYLQSRFTADCVDAQIETQAYALLKDPPAMQQFIVTHLRELWLDYFADEWSRAKPMLQEAVTAFSQLGLAQLMPLEAARKVIGQEVPDRWREIIAEHNYERVVFVPSAHLGPYLGTLRDFHNLYLLFGARLPEGTATQSPDLNRSELLMRLGALSDDTRLQILQLIGAAGQLCSKEIMTQLNLSQSATSRHLTQLTASGYLDEQWRDGTKCYSLNKIRIKSTLSAVEQFLLD